MTAKRKGDILEDLVAMMHEVPGVVVEKRKKLPSTCCPMLRSIFVTF
jgi:hypothetical protein